LPEPLPVLAAAQSFLSKTVGLEDTWATQTKTTCELHLKHTITSPNFVDMISTRAHINRSRPRLKNNCYAGLFRTYTYPAPYPEGVPGSAERRCLTVVMIYVRGQQRTDVARVAVAHFSHLTTHREKLTRTTKQTQPVRTGCDGLYCYQPAALRSATCHTCARATEKLAPTRVVLYGYVIHGAVRVWVIVCSSITFKTALPRSSSTQLTRCREDLWCRPGDEFLGVPFGFSARRRSWPAHKKARI